MISNCAFLPCRSVPILVATVDLPTIPALKASFESDILEQVTITYNIAAGQKTRVILSWKDFPLEELQKNQKQRIVQLFRNYIYGCSFLCVHLCKPCKKELDNYDKKKKTTSENVKFPKRNPDLNTSKRIRPGSGSTLVTFITRFLKLFEIIAFARCHPLFNHQNNRHTLCLLAAEEVSCKPSFLFLLHIQFEEHVIFHFWKEVKAVTDSIVLVSA